MLRCIKESMTSVFFEDRYVFRPKNEVLFVSNVNVQGYLNVHGIKALSPTDIVVGDLSTAWGTGITLLGNRCSAYGDGHFIKGDYVFTTGVNNRADGSDKAVLLGEGLIANSNHAVVFGRYNAVDELSGDVVFAIGSGTGDDVRRDAFRVYSNGVFALAAARAERFTFKDSADGNLYYADGAVVVDSNVRLFRNLEVANAVRATTAEFGGGLAVGPDGNAAFAVAGNGRTTVGTDLVVGARVAAPRFEIGSGGAAFTTAGTGSNVGGEVVLAGADLRVLGNLAVDGQHTLLETQVYTSDHLAITNLGTDTALVVSQDCDTCPIADLLANNRLVARAEAGGLSVFGNVVSNNHLLVAGNLVLQGGGDAVTGNVAPLVDNEFSIGRPDARYRKVYVTQLQATSDEREKTAIQPCGLGLDFVRSLQPVQFTWSGDTDGGGIVHYGLIAQHVERALAAAAAGGGIVEQSAAGTYTLNYVELIAPLIRAVKELSDQVSALAQSFGRAAEGAR